MTGRRDITFVSRGIPCAAWHLTAATDEFDNEYGRPCVVMAHGFGGTRDTGLLGYAEGFASAGLDVLLFDYRGFGDSDGQKRQVVSYRAQRDDYQAAIAAARALPGVDPARIVLWGTSYSGGHVVPVAVADDRIAAVLSLTPAMDGVAALGAIAKRHPVKLALLVLHGLLDLLRMAFGRAPHVLPVVGEPGTTAMITAPGAFDGYLAVAGPTWRNEVCARAALEVAMNRPIKAAPRLRAPMLVQVGEDDAVAPPAAAWDAAAKAGRYAQVRNYPIGHFDVYAGDWQRRVLADQLDFLTRTLSNAPSTDRAPLDERQTHR